MAKTNVIERPQVRAVAKYIGTSPFKVRQVAGLIRGKDVEAAQNELLLTQRGSSHEVSKLLNSAVANAEHNNQIPAEELKVAEIFIDEGPTLKRFRARARGRGSKIFKRTCHITIVLERMTDEEMSRKSEKEANTGAAGAREQRRRRAEASKAAQAKREEEKALQEAAEDETSTSHPGEADLSSHPEEALADEGSQEDSPQAQNDVDAQSDDGSQETEEQTEEKEGDK